METCHLGLTIELYNPVHFLFAIVSCFLRRVIGKSVKKMVVTFPVLVFFRFNSVAWEKNAKIIDLMTKTDLTVTKSTDSIHAIYMTPCVQGLETSLPKTKLVDQL